MPVLSNIFFDLDGTLTDPNEGITNCLQYALKQLGQPIHTKSELARFIGPALRNTFRTLLSTDNKNLIEKAVDLYRERYTEIGIYESQLYDGITELLSELNQNSFRLFVVTTKPKVYAERIIWHFQLNRYFNNIFGPSLDGRYDDKAELIGFILQNHALVSEETVMIGDRKEDVLAGKANRLQTIGVTYGYGSDEELLGCAPDYICHRPSEILAVILGE